MVHCRAPAARTRWLGHATHLGVPKVHDLIQQLVDEHKVVLYALLAELAAKVGLEEGDHLRMGAAAHRALHRVHQVTGASRQLEAGQMVHCHALPYFQAQKCAHWS